MKLSSEKLSLYSLFNLVLGLAISVGICSVVWDRIANNITVANNPTFQTTLLFIILYGIGKILEANKFDK